MAPKKFEMKIKIKSKEGAGRLGSDCYGSHDVIQGRGGGRLLPGRETLQET